jgi:large-conductance mechanosensitive channel
MERNDLIVGDNIQKFIVENVLGFGVGYLVASNIKDLMSSFVNTILSPVIAQLLIHGGAQNLNEFNITIFGATLNIGQFINEIIKFIAIMAIIFYLIKYNT